MTDAGGASAAEAPYTLRHIQQMLGLSRGAIAGLIDAGFVAPARGRRNEWRFTFRDVVLLRTAHQLRAARIPARTLMRSLRQLKARLSDDLPLAGLRIRAVGNDVAVLGPGAVWEAGSGQLLLDLELAPAPDRQVAFLPAAPPTRVAAVVSEPEAPAPDAAAWFEHAELIEGSDFDAAEAAYRKVLSLEPRHADAWINLGALLCERGRWRDALKVLDAAVVRCPAVALVHFNRGVALEDAGRADEALASYRRAIALDPRLADAYFNAARLLDDAGQSQAALRHYSAYRRLQPRRGG